MIKDLEKIVDKENILVDEPMKGHTTFRVGGACDYFVSPTSVDEIRALVGYCCNNNIPYYMCGNGSNLLVSDSGFRGVVIHLGDKFADITWLDDVTAKVKAGCLMSKFGNEALKRSLTGFEFATGIPGTIGGGAIMNAGAYGGELKDCIISATLLDGDGNIIEVSNEDMEFGYRTSYAARNNMIVLDVTIKLEPGNNEDIKAKLNELRDARRSKQPLEFPSAGSTFKRPEGYFAGKLIQDAGFKGFKHNDAAVSDKHSGFVINYDNATASDILELIKIVQDGVFKQFGVELEMEVKKLGEF